MLVRCFNFKFAKAIIKMAIGFCFSLVLIFVKFSQSGLLTIQLGLSQNLANCCLKAIDASAKVFMQKYRVEGLRTIVAFMLASFSSFFYLLFVPPQF